MDKKVSDSMTEQMHLVRYEDMNGENRLFGGKLVSWIDEVASITAIRHCGTKVTTASIDNLQFKQAARLNDIIVNVARVTYVGNTSLEIRVDTYIENTDGYRHPINRAYLTVVSLNEDDIPAKIKNKLVIETESEKAEWESAQKRISIRRQRRAEGF